MKKHSEERRVTQPFDAKRYWESRLDGQFDLGGVGDIGLSEAYNRYLYRVRGHVFRSVLKRLDLVRDDFEALDIGSGTGFYVDEWLRHGPRQLTGSDLTNASVKRLREKFPGAQIIQFDIGAELSQALADQQFDAVTAMDMLFHIVDDAAYERAFSNFAKLLRMGGWLIFSENLLKARKSNGPHQVSRAEAEVRDLLTANGFEVRFVQPMFALMNDPIRSDSRLLRRLFASIHRLAARGETAGKLIGSAIYPLELLAVRALSRGPSTEIFVCRRLPSN